MNCYQAKADELTKQWYVIDATDMVVGRLAAQIAPILMGKHRPTYTPHIDTGDYVIVTNVDKVVFTGNKWTQKSYQRYSGHPGGQKEEQAWKLFKRKPERILELAIKRMMPKNKIGRHMMRSSSWSSARRTRTRPSRRSRWPRSPAGPASAGGLFRRPQGREDCPAPRPTPAAAVPAPAETTGRSEPIHSRNSDPH